MRILLDEDFPVDFAAEIKNHHVFTVHSLGWAGIKNGALLRKAHQACDVFLTLDRNLEFQQNIEKLKFGVVVVRSVSNRVADLKPLVNDIVQAIDRVQPGTVEHAGN